MLNPTPIPTLNAIFVEEVEIDGSIYPNGNETPFEVLEEVLALPFDEVLELQDNHDNSDVLAPTALRDDHGGPFQVTIEKELTNFLEAFGIAERPDARGLEPLTAETWEKVRAAYQFGELKDYSVVVTRTSTREVTLEIRGRTLKEAESLALEQSGNIDFPSQKEAIYEAEATRV